MMDDIVGEKKTAPAPVKQHSFAAPEPKNT